MTGEARTRALGGVVADDGAAQVHVAHIYQLGDHGGRVALAVAEDADDGPAHAVLLTAEDALALANRLTRGANLVLEAAETRPDLDAEWLRWTDGRQGT